MDCFRGFPVDFDPRDYRAPVDFAISAGLRFFVFTGENFKKLLLRTQKLCDFFKNSAFLLVKNIFAFGTIETETAREK